MRAALRHRNRMLFIGDLLLIVGSVLGSFALRLPLGPLFIYCLPQAGWMFSVALIIKPIIYFGFGLYRRVWAYASTRELKLITVAVTTASVAVSLTVILLASLRVYTGFPRSVLAIDWLLSLLAVGGLRFALRLLAESRSAGGETQRRGRRVLLVGAGDAGALVVRE